ncbi:threonine-phosphate decarboxylase CobD [Natronomonas sp. F2-12]|jgi:L-threonine-O-3-phosphate decarboxylase|uniref:threonine-phosphate decarboxylase n=1 Tax=Natronomonas aquatica TaxID=2841590 RepID=A0A9R1CRG6_9EURY|nr:threonine-phosphate decarboxylase CobD [Natronomonas aquatica]MCQ4332585.1 threonine-phosphate decarboxylase CobD [Natronomonas aquatica]
MDPDSVDSVDRVPHGSSDEPDVLDLSANINPRTPAGTRAVYGAAFEDARSYPNDGYPAYRDAAAGYVGCDPEAVVPTAGGLSAIRLAIGVTVAPGDRALVPYPSFGEYAREIELAGGRPEFVPYEELLERDPAGYAMAIVCTPNNPTGECPPPGDLRAFADRCAAAGTTLLADEAFLGFTDRESLAGREGVVVARSLTKLFGLPGLRAGFAVAEGNALDRLQRARPAWSLGGPAAAVGAHAMRDGGFVAETRRRLARERANLRAGLRDRGFDVTPSEAPFLLCDVGEPPAELLAALRRNGVVLRDATTFRGLDRHVRIAVRDREATDRLLSVLDEVR